MQDYESFGVMIDCSGGAVMNVSQVKKFMDTISAMGYNSLQLYTEDTYEVDSEPYFGYCRGKYTKAELRELDEYAKVVGIELVPCIQTLAHLRCMFRWGDYYKINDCDDILLIGEERTYELIEHIFATLRDCFSSKRVNIGMDEAYMVGLGNYLQKHGYQNRFDIIYNHLLRIIKIAEKYDFRPMMWSDMFFTLSNNGKYYGRDIKISDELKSKVPPNVDLVYWDYYHTDKTDYDEMIRGHKQFNNKTVFAGGIWGWVGFAPSNTFSIKASRPALSSCLENGVTDVIMTLWGTECSRFSLLPALMFAIETAKGNTDLTSIKQKFAIITGESYDAFMALDLPNLADENLKEVVNPSRYYLYNDLFNGFMDTLLSGGENERYKVIALKLKKYAKNSVYGYIFDTLSSLCKALSIKSELGIHIRKAYQDRNLDDLAFCVKQCDKLLKALDKFYYAFKKQFYIENKTCGFDVQDQRLGGLHLRIKSCKERLQEFLEGKIDKIDELENSLLDYCGNNLEYTKKSIVYFGWKENVTANPL